MTKQTFTGTVGSLWRPTVQPLCFLSEFSQLSEVGNETSLLMSSASPNWLQTERDSVIPVVLASARESSGMWTGSVDVRCPLLSLPRTTHGDLDSGGPRGHGTQQALRSLEGDRRTGRAVADAGLQRAWLLDKEQKERRSRC